MIVLIVGLFLWCSGHYFKRALPDLRARLGARGSGVSALLILGGLVLMIVGYRTSNTGVAYFPPDWGIHANNFLMVIAVILVGMGSSKGKMRSWFRHPMLMAASVWSVAHLLISGDWVSVVLFGGIGLWSVSEMFLINVKVGPWERPEPGPVSGDIKLLVISGIVFAVITGIHVLLGLWPFPG